MIGGGQLARMSAAPATALGIEFWVLATSHEESAAQVVAHTMLGDHDSQPDVLRFAEAAKVITFDHEHVPLEILRSVIDRGYEVRPSPSALAHAQDKLVMRRALTSLGVPCPAWAEVEVAADVAAFAEQHSWPVVLKVSRGGYDGRGVWVVNDELEAEQVLASNLLKTGAAWLVEQKVEFTRELSAQVARSPHGQAVAYPVVRTVQTNGICTEVVAPCPQLSDEHAVTAQRIALEIAGALGVVGMLAVEMFDTADGVVVNELAMRPHNSGHWTIDGAVTSQFENHLRAVLDLPLGAPTSLAPYSVMVNILGGDVPDLFAAYKHVLARDPGLKVHLYGKEVRPGRKVGHVTVIGENLDDLLERAHHAADYFTGTIDE